MFREALGVSVQPGGRVAADASVGATDFGLYFTYWSFFIASSALLLAILFFRLGVEARLKQIGILRASGFTIATIRRLLLTEAVALAVLGDIIGTAGAIVYGNLIIRPANLVARGRYHAACAACNAALTRPRSARWSRRGRSLRAGVAADDREAVATIPAHRADDRSRAGRRCPLGTQE